jgi:hypothetical protein
MAPLYLANRLYFLDSFLAGCYLNRLSGWLPFSAAKGGRRASAWSRRALPWAFILATCNIPRPGGGMQSGLRSGLPVAKSESILIASADTIVGRWRHSLASRVCVWPSESICRCQQTLNSLVAFLVSRAAASGRSRFVMSEYTDPPLGAQHRSRDLARHPCPAWGLYDRWRRPRGRRRMASHLRIRMRVPSYFWPRYRSRNDWPCRPIHSPPNAG